jgi:hypothetical protein
VNKRHVINPYPNVIGRPAGSLHEMNGRASAGQINAGRLGEQKTASVLGRLCVPGGPTVLHDLTLPMRGISANIDHIVVSGRNVTIIDSKYWKPGIYWTLFGRTFNGVHRVKHADKRTTQMASRAIGSWLQTRHGHNYAIVKKPILVIWPSSQRGASSLFFYSPITAVAMSGAKFTRRMRHTLGSKQADPSIVAALMPLVKVSRTATGPVTESDVF